jgi:hypothetical protein
MPTTIEPVQPGNSNGVSPGAVTGHKLAANVDNGTAPAPPGLWDTPELMRHIPVCRRTVASLRAKGMPFLVLGRRVFFHPASIQAWLMRKERGGE